MNHIYLDNASATKIDPEVLKTINNANKVFANPSSLHTAGRQAKTILDASRKTIAKILGCNLSEIIFTGSGTESDNLAILGVARANKKHGNHLIISAIEHKAVLEPAKQLQKEGFKISFLKPKPDGLIDPEDLKKALTSKTILVSIMDANNEIGTVEPISKLANIIHSYKKNKPFPYFHTDACQSAGFLPLETSYLNVDLMTLNGSKIYGPKGVGILYVKRGVNIEPIMFGGGQENGLRPGTENIANIAGFAKALEIANKKRKQESARLTNLRDYFFKEIKKQIPNVVINGSTKNRLPNNINISLPGNEGEAVLMALDNAGILISTGSACTTKDPEGSHVLKALGLPPKVADSSIRLTLGKNTTKQDLDKVIKYLKSLYKEGKK